MILKQDDVEIKIKECPYKTIPYPLKLVKGKLIVDKKDFFELIREGPYKGQYRILIDRENRWGPIVDKQQAEKMWSRFKNSGQSFDEFVEEWL